MFTAVDSAAGAVLIHFATTQYLSEAGKTVGFSSVIANTAFQPSVYPVAVVAGLLLSTATTYFLYPEYLPPAAQLGSGMKTVAGLLVGLGTKWGSGCTSGHMLCGLSLLRVRSLVATVVFCATAMLTVNYWDLAPLCKSACASPGRIDSMGKLVATLVTGFIISKIPPGNGRARRAVSGLKAGFLFGMGLFITGMANPAKPQGFLALFNQQKFDPSLAMIVLFAIVPNVLRWPAIIKSKPANEEKFDLPTSTAVPPKFLLGNALFGIGWGLAGICPGPGLITSVLSVSNLGWLAAFVAGQYLGSRL